MRIEDEAAMDGTGGLPVPLAPRAGRAGAGAGSAFVSQLLAARDRLAPQRERRRAPVDAALSAYRDGAVIAVRRLPPGYRKTLVV